MDEKDVRIHFFIVYHLIFLEPILAFISYFYFCYSIRQFFSLCDGLVYASTWLGHSAQIVGETLF